MRFIITCISAAAAALFPIGMGAQGRQLVIEQHIRTKRLAAVVVDPTGAVIPGVRISLFKCPTGEFRGTLNFVPIAEKLTDHKGRFSFPWPNERVCVQVESPGMDLLQIEVLRDDSGGGWEVKLTPGT